MKIDVTETQTSLPSMSGRKQLIIENSGASDLYYGWEKSTVATDNEYQGVKLAAGAVIAFADPHIDLGGALFLICATGQSTTVNYTQRG